MKKIFYSGILFCMIALSGCSDLLDVSPKTDLTDSGFWNSEKDFEGACNKLYYDLTGWTFDIRADDLVGKSASGVSNGSRTVPEKSDDDWTNPYLYIYVANNIIEKGSQSPLSEAVRNRWIAEARFFRAYHYFGLVKKYGDVPLVLKVFTTIYDPDLKMGRTPREEVIQQCYSDLEFAAANLPGRTSLPTTELGRRRASRSAALGMTLRMGLHEGTFAKYHNTGNANAHLDKAIAAFELLKEEGHSLFPDFNDVYSYLNEANASNPEIVFGKAYGPNDFATVTTGHVYTRNMEGSYALTRNILDQVLYADGLPGEKSSLKLSAEDSYNNVAGLDKNGNELPGGMGKRDPRLLKTIWTLNDALQNDAFVGWGVTGKGIYYPFDSQRPYGYPVKKAFFGSLWEKSVNNKDFTDKIIIRYAECLISYAEALYERHGAITDAQLDATVNRLRERAGFDKKLTNGFVSANGLNMRDEIRRERTVELMAEGFRYDDIIRWKIAEEVLPVDLLGPICLADELQSASNYSTLEKRVVGSDGTLDNVFVYELAGTFVTEFKNTRSFKSARDYYYPIPTQEIGRSDGNIEQNPEWNK